MLSGIIHWFKGYLLVRLDGKVPERFINLCKYKNIRIWDLKSDGYYYDFKICASDYLKLKPFCRKLKSHPKITAKIGAPFHIKYYKYNKSFLLGFLSMITLLFIMSNFIWTINISGNCYISKDIIFDYLKTENTFYGILRTKVDCEKITAGLRKEFPQITWASTSINGTELNIEMKEAANTETTEETVNKSKDIIAQKTGVVRSIITRKGIPQVQIGDTVKKGSVLISGIIPINNDNGEVITEKQTTAEGDVLLEIVESYSDTIQTVYLKKIYDNNDVYNLKIRWNSWIFETKFSSSSDIREDREIILTDYRFPISISVIKSSSYHLDTGNYAESERAEILNAKLEKYFSNLENENIIILEKNINIYHGINHTYLSGFIKMQLYN